MIRNLRNISFGIHLRHPYNKAGDGPEGPESRIVTEWLHSNFKNCIITKIVYNKATSLYKNGTALNIEKYLPLTIEGITCKGKHIIWICNTSNNQKIYFHNHLGMSGIWLQTPGEHSNMHLVIKNLTELNQIEQNSEDNEQELRKIYFDDVRRFGDFSICYSVNELSEKLRDVGTDLMDTAIKYYNNDIELLRTVQRSWYNHYVKLATGRSKNKDVFSALMDQKHFAGIGAYVACEILYSSKISPERKVSQLSADDIVNLFNNCIEILYKSYVYGGVSVKDFLDPDGKIGKFPRKVYGNDKDPNGYNIVKTKFSNGRTCQWVKEVQK